MIGVSLRLVALTDEVGRLVAVEGRHPDVHEDDRELCCSTAPECGARRIGPFNSCVAEPLE